MNQKDIQCVNEIKILALDMINMANSGHPGVVLSAAPIVYTLYANHLRVIPQNPDWINRDRFVLSCGHASALLYATLHLAGYNISMNDLKSFRRINSITPGHPEYGVTPGIECTTGPLGQGIGQAVGMALAQRYIKALLEQEEDKKQKIIDYKTYVLCSDGDLMEGVSYEALSFAGAQKLNDLIILYDDNNMSIDGSLETTFNEDIQKRFESIGFDVITVKDGSNLVAIDKAISNAKKSSKPVIIVFKTILGNGSYNQNTNQVHGAPLADADLYNLRQTLNITTQPFYITKDSIIHMQSKIESRMAKEVEAWNQNLSNAKMSKSDNLDHILNMLENKINNINFDSSKYQINDNYNEELRISNYKVMNLFANKTNLILNGSADLFSSVKNVIDNSPIMSNVTPLGRNIRFGVREHAMGAILNGMALSGLKVCGSTFLAFSDYLKPAVRMSALMSLPVTYIFSHDSILVGQDGPTHEPIEQLDMLRTIPNLITYRPADITELMGCWDSILKQTKPTALIVTKEKCPKIPNTNSKNVGYGAYLIRDCGTTPDAILISSGTEVKQAYLIANKLATTGVNINVVSIPSLELYLNTTDEYKNKLLPNNIKRIVIEAGSSYVLGSLATSPEYVIGLNDFGFSGTSLEVAKEMEFDIDNLLLKVQNLVKKQ